MVCAGLLALATGLTAVVSSCRVKSSLAVVKAEPQIDTVIYQELPMPGPDDTLFQRYSARNTHPDSLWRLLYRRCEGNLSIVYDRFAALRSSLPQSLSDEEYLDTLTTIYTQQIAQSPEQGARLRPWSVPGSSARLVRELYLRSIRSPHTTPTTTSGAPSTRNQTFAKRILMRSITALWSTHF